MNLTKEFALDDVIGEDGAIMSDDPVKLNPSSTITIGLPPKASGDSIKTVMEGQAHHSITSPMTYLTAYTLDEDGFISGQVTTRPTEDAKETTARAINRLRKYAESVFGHSNFKIIVGTSEDVVDPLGEHLPYQYRVHRTIHKGKYEPDN